MTATTPGQRVAEPPGQDPGLRKELGFWHLTGVAFGGIIGSGWLFGAFYGAKAAGPAAVLSWVIAGAALTLVALVLVELGAGSPEAGGMVRWPLLANGPLAGSLIGWAILLALASALAAEASAIVQYADRYLPGLYTDSLTVAGKLAAAGVLALLVVLNWFGVKLFARLNLLVTSVKVLVPVLTIVALLVSSFHPENVTTGGGLAPYGWSAALTAIAGAGIVYTINGFAAPMELSAEVRDPRRNIPRAVLTAIGIAVVLYVLLQLTFILAVPPESLGGGWRGLTFVSPFGELALLLNLGWLAALIYADAVFSPWGSTYVFTATGGRQTYAVSRNRALPRRFAAVDRRSGVPKNALALNFVLSMVFLLPSGGWHEIIGVVGVLSLLTYSLCSVAAGSFLVAAPHRLAGWVRGLRWIAPAGFAVATLLIYWASWQHLRIALPVLMLTVLLFAVLRRHELDLRVELRTGAWLVGYLGWLVVLSGLGSFGGTQVIPLHWDTAVVALCALLTYRWGMRSGAAFLRRSS